MKYGKNRLSGLEHEIKNLSLDNITKEQLKNFILDKFFSFRSYHASIMIDKDIIENHTYYNPELKKIAKHFDELLSLITIDEVFGIHDYFANKNAYISNTQWELFSNGEERLNLLKKLFGKNLTNPLHTSIDLQTIIDPVNTLWKLIEQNTLDETTLKKLITQGVNLNLIRYDKGPFSGAALSWACYKDASPEIIQVLLAYGADTEAREHDEDWTALLYACQYASNIEVLQVLIQHEANVNVTCLPYREYEGALDLLCMYDKPTPFVKLLLAAGADAQKRNPLQYCVGYYPYYTDDGLCVTKFENARTTGELLVLFNAEIEKSLLEKALSAKAPGDVISFLITDCGLKVTEDDFYKFCSYAVPSIELFDLFLAQGAAQADFRKVVNILYAHPDSAAVIKHCVDFINCPAYWKE